MARIGFPHTGWRVGTLCQSPWRKTARVHVGRYVFEKASEQAHKILLEDGMTNFFINSVDVSEAVLPKGDSTSTERKMAMIKALKTK